MTEKLNPNEEHIGNAETASNYAKKDCKELIQELKRRSLPISTKKDCLVALLITNEIRNHNYHQVSVSMRQAELEKRGLAVPEDETMLVPRLIQDDIDKWVVWHFSTEFLIKRCEERGIPLEYGEEYKIKRCCRKPKWVIKQCLISRLEADDRYQGMSEEELKIHLTKNHWAYDFGMEIPALSKKDLIYQLVAHHHAHARNSSY